MVMGAHHWCLGSFPERAQDENFWRWARRPGRGTCSSQGTSSPVDGGFPGRGAMANFAAASITPHWVILGCADATTHRPSVHVVVPRADLEVDDTWHVMGLQGTGSKDVVAHNVMVPSHRTIDTRTLFRGASPHAVNHPTNLYRLSAEAMLSVSVSTAVLGSAKFAPASVHRADQGTPRGFDWRAKGGAWPDAGAMAEAAAEIHSADLLIHDILGEFDRLMTTGETFDSDHRVRAKWQAAYAAELCRRAVARMSRVRGRMPCTRRVRFRPHFETSMSARSTPVSTSTISAEQYARARLGLSS